MSDTNNILDNLDDIASKMNNLLSNESVSTSVSYSKEHEEMLIRITIKNVNIPFKSFTVDDIKNII